MSFNPTTKQPLTPFGYLVGIIHSEGSLDRSEVSEVRLKEVRSVGQIIRAHHLTNTVHTQLGHAQVHRADACVGG